MGEFLIDVPSKPLQQGQNGHTHIESRTNLWPSCWPSHASGRARVRCSSLHVLKPSIEEAPVPTILHHLEGVVHRQIHLCSLPPQNGHADEIPGVPPSPIPFSEGVGWWNPKPVLLRPFFELGHLIPRGTKELHCLSNAPLSASLKADVSSM